MAISLTHFGSGSNTTGATITMSGSIPAGSLIVFSAVDPGGAPSPADTGGNTWHLVGGSAIPLGGFVGFTFMHYAFNSLSIASGSVSWTPSTAGGGACSVFYATGIATASDPIEAATIGTGSNTGTSPSAVMGATPTAGSLVVAVVGTDGPNTDSFSQGVGFSAPPNREGSTGGGSSIEILLVGDTGTITTNGGNALTIEANGDVFEDGVYLDGSSGSSAVAYDPTTDTIYAQDAASGNWYSWDGAFFTLVGSLPAGTGTDYTIAGGSAITSSLLAFAPTINSRNWGSQVVAFAPVAGAVASGAAVIHGIGSLTATAARTGSGAIIPGTGRLTANATVRPFQAAVLNGSGAVSARTLVRAAGRAAVSGVGLITPNFKLTLQAKAVLSGVGSVFPFVNPPDPPFVPPVIPPPAPTALDRYLSLIPNYNAVQPNFMATLAASMQPLVDLQSMLGNMPQDFDLDTAVGVQLDQVGIWIGIGRFIKAPITGVYFSWDIVGLGWEQGTWQGTFDPSEGLSRLDDETYRQVLYAKVGSNHWDSSIGGITDVLTALFGSQGVTISVVDGQDMTMTVNVTGTLNSAVFRALLVGGYIPIKPEGVTINYVFS